MAAAQYAAPACQEPDAGDCFHTDRGFCCAAAYHPGGVSITPTPPAAAEPTLPGGKVEPGRPVRLLPPEEAGAAWPRPLAKSLGLGSAPHRCQSAVATDRDATLTAARCVARVVTGQVALDDGGEVSVERFVFCLVRVLDAAAVEGMPVADWLSLCQALPAYRDNGPPPEPTAHQPRTLEYVDELARRAAAGHELFGPLDRWRTHGDRQAFGVGARGHNLHPRCCVVETAGGPRVCAGTIAMFDKGDNLVVLSDNADAPLVKPTQKELKQAARAEEDNSPMFIPSTTPLASGAITVWIRLFKAFSEASCALADFRGARLPARWERHKKRLARLRKLLRPVAPLVEDLLIELGETEPDPVGVTLALELQAEAGARREAAGDAEEAEAAPAVCTCQRGPVGQAEALPPVAEYTPAEPLVIAPEVPLVQSEFCIRVQTTEFVPN